MYKIFVGTLGLVVFLVGTAFAVTYEDADTTAYSPWKITYSGDNITKNSDNSLTITDAGAAGGDSISIDGVAVVDPDFVSTGDIDFVDTANTVTANINANAVKDDEIDYTAVTLNDFTFDVGSVSKTEYGYVNGVTSAIQAQIDNKLFNNASDIMTGTLTADGLALGADENITLGTATIQYDTAEGDIDIDEDVNIKQADPHVRLAPTVGDAFEWYAFGNESFITNYTDGVILLRTHADNTVTSRMRQSKSFTITDPTATSDYPLWKVPRAITITAIDVLCEGGTNIIGGLDEADGNGDSAVAIDADITGTVGTNVSDDGSLTNPSVDAGDYLLWHTSSISGSPSSVTVTFEYYEN